MTTMLVITTMFINVSNNLPKTAYIKMINVWLLFNLTKPFVDILVTTYIDSLKTDEGREINHRGNPRTVGEKEDNKGHSIKVAPVKPLDVNLVHTNEIIQQRALKDHYEKRQTLLKQEQKIKRWKRFSLVTNPIICIIFIICYWVLGMNDYFKDV